MALFDLLPDDLLHEIAAVCEGSYKALVLSYPRFARQITPGRRVDYRIAFGHSVQVVKAYGGFCRWTRRGKKHRLDGPAIDGPAIQKWRADSAQCRTGLPAMVNVVLNHADWAEKDNFINRRFIDGQYATVQEWYDAGMPTTSVLMRTWTLKHCNLSVERT